MREPEKCESCRHLYLKACRHDPPKPFLIPSHIGREPLVIGVWPSVDPDAPGCSRHGPAVAEVQ